MTLVSGRVCAPISGSSGGISTEGSSWRWMLSSAATGDRSCLGSSNPTGSSILGRAAATSAKCFWMPDASREPGLNVPDARSRSRAREAGAAGTSGAGDRGASIMIAGAGTSGRAEGRRGARTASAEAGGRPGVGGVASLALKSPIFSISGFSPGERRSVRSNCWSAWAVSPRSSRVSPRRRLARILSGDDLTICSSSGRASRDMPESSSARARVSRAEG